MRQMEAKNVLYAAVGAPVVAARKVGDRVADWRQQLSNETTSYTQSVEKVIEGWAAEGKKVVDRIGSGNVVEEISSKVDLDQAKEQVGKLRDQLEDMLDTWRASFRPERAETVPAKKQPAQPPAEKPAAKTTAAKTTAAKKPAAKTTAAKKTPAKTDPKSA
ncbi:MAG: hypothetical protein ACRDVL_09290 [Acidimicrobiia bacterium]